MRATSNVVCDYILTANAEKIKSEPQGGFCQLQKSCGKRLSGCFSMPQRKIFMSTTVYAGGGRNVPA